MSFLPWSSWRRSTRCTECGQHTKTPEMCTCTDARYFIPGPAHFILVMHYRRVQGVRLSLTSTQCCTAISSKTTWLEVQTCIQMKSITPPPPPPPPPLPVSLPTSVRLADVARVYIYWLVYRLQLYLNTPTALVSIHYYMYRKHTLRTRKSVTLCDRRGTHVTLKIMRKLAKTSPGCLFSLFNVPTSIFDIWRILQFYCSQRIFTYIA